MEEVGKYLEDKKFILWVFNPDSELNAWWDQFKTDHPEEKKNLQLARNILLRFHTKNKELTDTEKILLFSRVLKQIEEKQHTGKVKRLVMGFMRYAAVAILFFSIGAAIFYENNQFNPQFNAQGLTDPIPENSAKLVRPSGEDILLKGEKSIIKYQLDGSLMVNNDTITAERSKSSKTGMNQLVIPFGKSSEILLADGTRVFLNAGSRLFFPETFIGDTREVYLVGEAFFDVKHDQEHPFIVHLNDLRIKVLGTRFNVSAYQIDNVVETVLEEGKVCIRRNNASLFEKEVELFPNQLASFDKATMETNVKSVDTDDYTLWTKGVMKFESTDLCRIIKKMERFYNIRFQFSDPLLGGLRISGKLDLKEDKDEICERIAHAASVNIVKRNENLYEIIK